MKKLLKHKEKILIIFILLLAAFLRLYKIDAYMTFLGDEGRDVLVVYNILHGRFTLLGPTSSVGGFFLGPIYYYFMTPFLWIFNFDPVGPAVMVALFGIATVFLVYKIGKEFFDQTTGFIASILFAISPLVIAYSRSSWNPNLMPFFSLSTLYILYKALKAKSIKLFILCGFLYGITLQLHYVATFLGVIILLYILSYIFLTEKVVFIKKFELIVKKGIFMLIGFILGLSPFFLFEVRHGFPNIRSIINFVLNSGETGGNEQFFSTIFNVFFRLFGRLVVKFPPPEQVSLEAHFNIALWYYATLLLAVVSIVVFLLYFLYLFRKIGSNFQKPLLLFLWFFTGIFIFGFYKKSIYDYYFGFMFPLPFLFTGLLISYLWNGKILMLLNIGNKKEVLIKGISKIVGVLIFVVLIYINFTGVPFRFPANRQLDQVRDISRFIFDKVENKPFNFALITGGNSDHAYRYFFTLWGNPPTMIQNSSNDPKRKTVKDQLWVICEAASCAPLGHSLWEIAGFGRAEIEKEWDVSVVKVIKLKHYKGEFN